jgi:dTDP-4-dehydrorhamnose reductase
MRTALVVGARGLIGGALVEALGPGRSTGTFARRPAPGLERLDLAEAARNPEVFSKLVDRTDPEAIFLAAGTSSAEACEADEPAARAEHAEATAVLASFCAKVDLPLVFFSPDGVFDGSAGPYTEDAGPAPPAVLGRTKRLGEMAVLKASRRNLVVRSCWVFGPEADGAGIAYRIAGALKAGRTVPVAADQYSTPTYSRDLARAAVALVANGDSGIVHVAGPEVLNAASFALLVAARAKAPDSLVRPVPSATLGMAALRPPWGGLLCGRLRSCLPGFAMRAPGAAMDHWMKNQRGALWPF